MNEDGLDQDERDEIDKRYELTRLQLLAQLRDIVGTDELINLLCLIQKSAGKSGQG